MTDERGDPIQRWGLIFHGRAEDRPTHSRHEWRRIVDAIRIADAALRQTVGDAAPRYRGDQTWCQIATTAYSQARGSIDVTGAQERACFADEDVIRAWLDAPWVPGGAEPATMAGVCGVDDAFRPGRAPDPASVQLLVTGAQDLGLIGIPGVWIGLFYPSGDPTRGSVWQLAVGPGDGLGQPVGPLDVEHLLGSARTSADVVVAVLSRVAEVVNQRLAPAANLRPAQDRLALPAGLASWVDGYPVGQRGRAFPPLRLTEPDTAPPAGPGEATAPAPRQHR